MKRSSSSSSAAFTLIEMLTVMAVIAVLASLVVAVNAFAQKKAALTRADGEIHAMSAACENYKADFGNYPRDIQEEEGAESVTDDLNPQKNGNPTSEKYRFASLFLYKALSGDAVQGTTPPDGPLKSTDRPDGKAETKGYFEFVPTMLRRTQIGGKSPNTGEIMFIQDPFGNPYGYSTAGAKAYAKYSRELKSNPAAVREEDEGYNPTFDLWSTGGQTGDSNDKRKRWVKNW